MFTYLHLFMEKIVVIMMMIKNALPTIMNHNDNDDRKQ